MGPRAREGKCDNLSQLAEARIARQPWGLGIDPAKFRAYLAAELGDKAADLETVSVDGRIDNGANQHTGPKVDSDHADPNPPEMSEPKEKRLRAILRAPAVVQELYRQGRITQTDAAKLGPMSPTPEQAARVAEARHPFPFRPFAAGPSPWSSSAAGGAFAWAAWSFLGRPGLFFSGATGVPLSARSDMEPRRSASNSPGGGAASSHRPN